MDDFIIVVDNFHSALALVASQRKKHMPCDIVAASDFHSPASLFRHLSKLPSERILFAWRGGLREALFSRKCRNIFIDLLESKTIHLLIPDLLGLEEANLAAEARLLNCAHGYWVTSKELFQRYSTAFPERIPDGIFHDLPNVDSIVARRIKESNRSGIIWVGNSKWGSNFGFDDHKGFYEIVKPLSRLLGGEFSIRIIDSAVSQMENDSVLKEIAERNFLIQASASEGTGLPLLEALGLGTVPITTEVGIAGEILTGEFASLIVDRNLESFFTKIDQIGLPDQEMIKGCIELFDDFVSKVACEELSWNRNEVALHDFEFEFVNSMSVYLKWLYRFSRRISA